MGTLKEDRYSSGSVIMIVVAAVGLFCAFIMIVCLLAMSRRRVRTQDRFSVSIWSKQFLIIDKTHNCNHKLLLLTLITFYFRV